MMPPVIILAGGLGMRLRSITHDKMPKPMVPVVYHDKGYPFLTFLLGHLYEQGIRKVIICVDHLADQVIAYLGDGHLYGMQISYDYAGSVQTAARVKHVLEKIDEPEVIIHCGDVFHPLNIEHFLNHFHQHPENLMQIAVHESLLNEDSVTNVTIDDNYQVIGYRCQHVLDTGVLIARREILSFIPDQPSASLNEDLYPALIQRQTVGAYLSSMPFYDIGTPGEYRRFCQFVALNNIQPLPIRSQSSDQYSVEI